MDELHKKFIPIGTVVKLKKSESLFIIIGYGASFEKNKDVKYDYISYLYPVGFTKKSDNYLFNYEDIEKIVFKGYADKIYTNFLNILGGVKND